MVLRGRKKIFHIGIQVQPDKTLPERMLLYSLAIKGKFGQKPVQIILFVGKVKSIQYKLTLEKPFFITVYC